MTKKLIIAIDGPAGSGKSTTAKALAAKLRIPYFDTGAMYRAVTLKAIQNKINLEDKKKLVAIAKKAVIRVTTSPKGVQKVYLDGKDVSKAIREPELTQQVFHVAQTALIRREMVKKQRAMAQKSGGVMEGRDIGTVVFPKAHFKFFFEANANIRATRRQRDLKRVGKTVAVGKVLKDLKFRDKTDYERKEGPLRCAKDAIRIDTSPLTIPETVDRILAYISAART